MKTRKELKEEYKQQKHKMGLYQIKNNSNGRIFIGSSLDLNAIWNRQKMQLKFGNHPSKTLQKDWKEFGEENFSYEILTELKHDDSGSINYNRELKALEEIYLEELAPYEEKGYNRRPVVR